MIKKRTLVVIFSVFLVLAAGVVFTYRYFDRRLTDNSIGIVVPEDDVFNQEIAPLPEGIQILTQEEFLAAMELEAVELTDEEFRQAIEREFAPDNTDGALGVTSLFLANDSIFQRVAISDRILNVLFIGDDARIDEDRGRSDSLVLISYNRDTRVITLTSFMRDILVPTGIREIYWNRINVLHAIGGPGRIINLINNLFSLDIQQYAVVRFTGVFMLVDALGGLEMYLTHEEAALINRIFPDYDPVFAGDNLLDGRQVLAYSRMRIIDNDLARTQRQRNVLSNILYKLLDTSSIGDIFTIVSFALDHVETNIPLTELITIGVDLFSGPRPVIEELRIPIDEGFDNAIFLGAYILTINFEDNIKALHETIYGSSEGVRIPSFTLPVMDEPETESTDDAVNTDEDTDVTEAMDTDV